MDQSPVSPRLRKHLLLFYREGSTPPPGDELRPPRRSELESWAKTLETRGELVFMADVAPAGAASWLGSSEKPHLPVDLVGVCVIRARDRASALETARHSPHFGAGGLVAVYEIDPE